MLKLLLALLSISACLYHCRADNNLTVTAQGATSAAPLYSEWIFGYSLVLPSVTFTYAQTGSSNGLGSQISGQNDWSGSDVFPTSAQVMQASNNGVTMKLWPFVSLGFVPIVNFNNTVESLFVLDGPTLARIFAGTITEWKDPAILALNPTIADRLPNASITVVVRSDGSGSTEVWTEAMESFLGTEEWPYGSGQLWNQTLLAKLDSKILARGSYGIMANVLSTVNTIGYTSYAFAVESGSTYTRLYNSNGDLADVVNGITAAINGANNSGFDSLVNLPYKDAWPIATFTYGLTNSNNSKVSTERCQHLSNLVRFVEWALTENNPVQRAFSVGYTPLPAPLAAQVVKNLTSLQCNGLPVIQYSFIDQRSSGVWVTMLALACILCLIPIALFAVYISKPERRSLSNLGLWYTFMTLGGSVLLMSAVVLFYLVPTNDAICGLQPWFVGLGFVFLITPMLAKVFFLLLVTSESNWSVLVRPTAFALQIILLVVWTAVDLYSSQVNIVDKYSLTAEYRCQANHIWVWMGIEIGFFSTMLVIGLILTVLSQRAKAYEAQCAETSWIGFTIYNLTVFACILVPILAALDVSDEIRYFLICLGLIVPALGIDLALYGKMVIEYFETKRKDAHHNSSREIPSISGSSRDYL